MACCKPPPVHTKDDGHTFHPDYYTKGLTEKFYARHECQPINNTERVVYYENELSKIEDYDPRYYSCIPRYTNQNYGWVVNEKLQKLELCWEDKQDTILDYLRQYFDRPKKMQRLPQQFLYCKSKLTSDKNDHWKIV